MTRKANLILLLIAGLFLAALITRAESLAWMALPFLFYLGAGWLSAPARVDLRAERGLSRTRGETGEPLSMRVTIANAGDPIPLLRIIEPLAGRMEMNAGDAEPRVAMPAGQTLEYAYTFHAPRGRYLWHNLRAVASDPFGLFEQTVNLPAPAAALVLPQHPPLRRITFQRARTLRTVGPNRARLPGSGTDFWGVREYRPGDPLRGIHWRMSARHPGEFFTREFEREEMANIGILLDARASLNLTHGEENLLEYGIQAAASLAQSFLRAGNRVSLLALGERVARVFPGTGKYQLARILDQLAQVAPGEKVSFDTLKYLPTRLFPARSLIVVISPLRVNDFRSIARLRAEGYAVLLVSPDPVAFTGGDAAPGSPAALGFRAARLERAALLRRLRQIGVAVADWRVDQPLAKTLQAARRARDEASA